jgi:TetR/AcrR family transcriptional regulator, transcriptional repressor for nem operon
MPKPNVRERIVNAGLETFHRQGFNGAGVQDITDAARIPKGSFYNHFASKEALGVAALDRYWEHAGRALLLLRDESVAPVERLRRYFEQLGQLMARWNYTKGCLIGNFGAELADQSVPLRERTATLLADWSRAIEACVAQAQHAGAVRRDLDPGTLAAFIVNSWEGAVLRAKVDKDDAAFRQFLTVVFAAILT